LAAQLLIATTGIGNIAAAMQKLQIPDIFTTQLLLTYRYISVLIGETGRVSDAYTLRAPYQKGINVRIWGSLLGQLLLRTFDRAVRIYQAMKLRGYDNSFYGANLESIKRIDILYLVGWTIFFITVRIINLPMILGLLMTGMII
jgi:cobalt/nickel transport system permease protein